jgi:hypothetical protein
MMAGLFLMLWGAVGFVQNKNFFTSAPKEALDVIQPKEERFKGQHAVGWAMLILSLALMGGALIYGAYDGIKNGFGFWQFFSRFTAMLLLLKAFDILFFDYYLLCRSGFFSYYYPEVKLILGPHLFGFNRKSHMFQIVLIIACSLMAAHICILI